jgi:hypothetical protein
MEGWRDGGIEGWRETVSEEPYGYHGQREIISAPLHRKETKNNAKAGVNECYTETQRNASSKPPLSDPGEAQTLTLT